MTFFIAQIKEAYPELKVIMLTTDMSRERVMLLLEMGVDFCLGLPLCADGLAEMLAEAAKPLGRDGLLAHEALELLRCGKGEQAIDVCQKLLKLKPDHAMGHVLLGDALRQLEKHDAAREAYEKASCATDLFLTPLKRLADLARDVGQTEIRLLFLYRLDELSPLNVDRKMEMGEMHLELGQTREAERLFEKALTLAGTESSALVASLSEHIAGLYGDTYPVQAEKYLRHSLATRVSGQPVEVVYAINRLGLALRRQGRWQDALMEYHRAVQLMPDDSVLHYNMGMACLEGRDDASAVRHMSKALVLNPRLPYTGATVAFNMGMAFLKSNHTDEGLRCMKVAIKQNPGFEEAHKALRQFGVPDGEVDE